MSALPGAPQLARVGAALTLEGHALDDLAQRFGTPLFVYSRDAMREAASAYQRALEGRRHLLCYAMKANSNLAVLQVFAEMGCGFDIVSGGELARVLAIGAPASKVVFSGVGKTSAEMRQALQAGSLGDHLARRYPQPHAVRNDALLYDHAMALKQRHLRHAGPLAP